MSWDVKTQGYRWGERKLVKTNWFEGGKKTYRVKILEPDGMPLKMGESEVYEEFELQPFLEFCICCGQNVVNVHEGGGCSIQKSCCSACWRNCQEMKRCQLK